MLQRLNPVSPMDDCGSGCRESVTSGRAGLTLHRWFDASQCVPREALTAIRQKDVTNVGLQISKSGKFKALFEDNAIGTSTWVIYPKSSPCLYCIGVLSHTYIHKCMRVITVYLPRRGLTGC